MFVTLSFLLLAGATPQAAVQAKPAVPASDADKVVCKRSVETGSLVKGVRTCKAKREWERDRRQTRENMTQTNNGCRELNGVGGC